MAAGVASLARDFGSPAAFPLDSTPRETRRSSSRASRKTTREPESHSSYSLPPTPLTTSFEESFPSAKRRKTQRSVAQDEKNVTSQEPTENPASLQTSVSRKRDRQRKSALNSSEAVHLATPTASTSKPKSRPEQSQSTLHHFLSKKPQDRRKSLATPNASSANHKTIHTHSDDDPFTMSTSVSSRKTRQSMPAQLNGLDGDKKASSVESSASVSTPQPSHSRNPQGAKMTKTPAQVRLESKTSTNSAAKAPGQSGTKPTTPAVQPRSTPTNASTRSRRYGRKSFANAQSTPVEATASNRKPTSSVVTRTSSRPQRSTRKLAADAAINHQSLDHLSAPNTPFRREIADSIESTPAVDDKATGFEATPGFEVDTPGLEGNTPYGESFPFDYHSDMYRNNFGLDGNLDAPGSPTASFSTTTSAARTSGRTRKPTTKAMESIESERRFRRNRTPSVKPDPTPKETGVSAGKARVNQPTTLPNMPAPATQAVELDPVVIANRMLDLAAVALAPEFEPAPEVEVWMEELRQEFTKKQEGETQPKPETPAEAGAGGSSKPHSPSDANRWTDEDGFIYTGQLNEFGEELVTVGPGYAWYRPNNTYGDQQLPQPPVRLKSHEQLEKDRIFGFPPLMGERNLPREAQTFYYENVDEVKASIKAQKEAKKRGIVVDRMMTAAYIQALIAQHDENAAKEGLTEVKGTKEPTRKRRRGEASENTQVSKRRRREPTPVPEPPKTLRIKLTLKGAAAAAAAATKKRYHSDMEETPAETTSQEERPSPSKILKLSGLRRNFAVESTSTPSTPGTDTKKNTSNGTSDTSEAGPSEPNLGTTPGGRPRRRAAAALMAEFQNHAEQRARRANARKKGGSSDKPDDPDHAQA
ncbi:hypothetical protein BO94DRAFT_582885 [Aspergillus sclerotioniger CBS 115572]|uniref:GPI-anchored cell surface glycoprotein n=1 Tax=Aspergillus sclerotioniger CBS 115572 TaxID=1450535 RepID=A0A317X7G8_9EURO|nr:hypothetical protein BO94DRAFT_582885 [Aspergillus sclerotioniger CBS 115572]PWY93497.1 hypothetical protein BO94DRAFT_582885 [Aspergillus sclerotioniger CBS 115572]